MRSRGDDEHVVGAGLDEMHDEQRRRVEQQRDQHARDVDASAARSRRTGCAVSEPSA